MPRTQRISKEQRRAIVNARKQKRFAVANPNTDHRIKTDGIIRELERELHRLSR